MVLVSQIFPPEATNWLPVQITELRPTLSESESLLQTIPSGEVSTCLEPITTHKKPDQAAGLKAPSEVSLKTAVQRISSGPAILSPQPQRAHKRSPAKAGKGLRPGFGIRISRVDFILDPPLVFKREHHMVLIEEGNVQMLEKGLPGQSADIVIEAVPPMGGIVDVPARLLAQTQG